MMKMFYNLKPVHAIVKKQNHSNLVFYRVFFFLFFNIDYMHVTLFSLVSLEHSHTLTHIYIYIYKCDIDNAANVHVELLALLNYLKSLRRLVYASCFPF